MPDQERPQELESSVNLRHYITVLQRREAVIVFTAGLLVLLSLAAGGLWPPTVKATAMSLVEKEAIQGEWVHSTITR